jgi:hypothetical protein
MKILKQIIREILEESITKIDSISIDGQSPISINPENGKPFNLASAKEYSHSLGANTLDVFFSDKIKKKYVPAEDVDAEYIDDLPENEQDDYWILFNDKD